MEVEGFSGLVSGIKIDAAGGNLEAKGMFPATSDLARLAEKEIGRYLSDRNHKIDLPLFDHSVLPSQKAAMDFLLSIPCGKTQSYAEQAEAVRKKCGGGFNARNAGNANRRNHYPLAIPCHRVVRTGGDVGGFMGSDKDRARSLKRALLRHESAA